MAQRISLLILSWTLILQYIILDYINIILYYTIKLILYYMPHQRRTRNTNCKYLWVFSGPSPACSCHFVKSFRIPMPGLREHCIANWGYFTGFEAMSPTPHRPILRFCKLGGERISLLPAQLPWFFPQPLNLSSTIGLWEVTKVQNFSGLEARPQHLLMLVKKVNKVFRLGDYSESQCRTSK